jgi:hypothetical protein
VDPLQLRSLALAALSREGVQVHVQSEVTRVEDREDFAVLHGREGSVGEGFATVINAAWENQAQHAPPDQWHPLNYRVKLAVRVPRTAGDRVLTLVQGPFGDVVALPDYTYLSWYPVGRLAHEERLAPSRTVKAALESLAHLDSHGLAIASALRQTGLWDGAQEPRELTGGAMMGHGAVDIDSVSSSLHARSEFRLIRAGRVLTPLSFKFTTVPLGAAQAVATLEDMLA